MCGRPMGVCLDSGTDHYIVYIVDDKLPSFTLYNYTMQFTIPE